MDNTFVNTLISDIGKIIQVPVAYMVARNLSTVCIKAGDEFFLQYYEMEDGEWRL